MLAAVGRSFDRKVSFPISASDVRKWALAVHYPEMPPVVHLDETAAAARGRSGLAVPHEFNPFAWVIAEPLGPERVRDLVPDDVEMALGVEGPGLSSRLNGGYRVEYVKEMHVGDTIQSVKRLLGYEEKSGRLGRMLFTRIEDLWTRDGDDVLKRVEQTTIRYGREAAR